MEGFRCNNQLEEILKCVICYDRLIEGRMCPNCSKLCCKMCFHRWLIENRSQCPHCRSPLRLDQLVTVRFLNDITKVLENLAVPKTEASEKCANHGCELNYYCMTCSSAICSDCAMFTQDHKGHDFQHLANIHKQHVEQINAESKVLTKRLRDLENILQDLDLNIDKFKKAKDEKSRELILCMEQIQSRLDIQLQSKLHVLYRNKDEVDEEINKLKTLNNEVEKDLNDTEKSKLIAKSSDLIKKLKNVQKIPLNRFENLSLGCEFQSELVPTYDSGIFILKNYSKIQESSEVVYSSVLNGNGLSWRLKVYPNGNGVAKGNYLSVFLELLKGFGESAKYDYRVEMINHLDSNQCVVREFASEFETGECWGYNRFYRIDLLKQEGYIGDDTLIIKFYVRAPTYYQLYKDQKNYIKFLSEKDSQSKEQIQNLVKKLESYGETVSIQEEEEEKDINLKEDIKKPDDEIPKEVNNTSPNELSAMMQKYMMSPEDVSSDGEVTPKQLNWNESHDMPDFHSCSELMSQEFLESPDEEEKDFSPLG